MTSTITLNGIEVEITSDAARAFISDACRAGEGVISDENLMEKYDLAPEDLQKLANNKSIGRLILREREHRLRSGIATRELANGYFFKAPTVLDKIMSDEQANPRHKVEAIRELRVISTPENQPTAAQSERFIITINLGDDHIEHFDKAIKIDVDDSPPDAQPKLSGQPKLTIIANEGRDE